MEYAMLMSGNFGKIDCVSFFGHEIYLLTFKYLQKHCILPDPTTSFG